jgi:hypothetical protein
MMGIASLHPSCGYCRLDAGGHSNIEMIVDLFCRPVTVLCVRNETNVIAIIINNLGRAHRTHAPESGVVIGVTIDDEREAPIVRPPGSGDSRNVLALVQPIVYQQGIRIKKLQA